VAIQAPPDDRRAERREQSGSDRAGTLELDGLAAELLNGVVDELVAVDPCGRK